VRVENCKTKDGFNAPFLLFLGSIILICLQLGKNVKSIFYTFVIPEAYYKILGTENFSPKK